MTDAQVVLQICGTNNAEILVLETLERLDTLAAFVTLSSGDIKDLAGKLEQQPANAGRVQLPTILVKSI